MQPHLSKVFENIESVKFENNLEISTIYSKEGEELPLLRPIPTTQNQNISANNMVEDWMTQIEKEMKNAVKENITRSMIYLTSTEFEIQEWVQKFTCMSLIISSKIVWTFQVEKKLENSYLTEYSVSLKNRLALLVELIKGKYDVRTKSTIINLIVIY